MAQRIEFKLPDNAKNVCKHLYNVQLEGNCLVFSEFDEEAFELAVALESLDESAYEIVQTFQTVRTLSEYGAVVQHPARFYEPPKYVVKIKLLESVPCFALSANRTLWLGNFNKPEELFVDIVINEELSEFLRILLTQVSDDISVTLSGKIDRIVFVAKNLLTKNVQHFLAISCDSQPPQVIPLHPVKNVTIERVSFEEY